MGNPVLPTTVPTESLPPSALASSPLQLLQELSKLQATRIHAYKVFEEGFTKYITGTLPGADFEPIVTDTTIEFADTSRLVNVVAARLRDVAHRADLARMVVELQALEKAKLELTVQYQVGYSETVFGTRDYTADIAALKTELEHVAAQVNEKWDDIRAEMAEL
ncbi:DNA repair REX1-B-domain-containing protein [Powellomyces hirtus]|nr:DNA repair REX1-B-domain-containing protein [Powellomyces hirtus]